MGLQCIDSGMGHVSRRRCFGDPPNFKGNAIGRVVTTKYGSEIPNKKSLGIGTNGKCPFLFLMYILRNIY